MGGFGLLRCDHGAACWHSHPTIISHFGSDCSRFRRPHRFRCRRRQAGTNSQAERWTRWSRQRVIHLRKRRSYSAKSTARRLSLGPVVDLTHGEGQARRQASPTFAIFTDPRSVLAPLSTRERLFSLGHSTARDCCLDHHLSPRRYLQADQRDDTINTFQAVSGLERERTRHPRLGSVDSVFGGVTAAGRLQLAGPRKPGSGTRRTFRWSGRDLDSFRHAHRTDPTLDDKGLPSPSPRPTSITGSRCPQIPATFRRTGRRRACDCANARSHLGRAEQCPRGEESRSSSPDRSALTLAE